MSIAQNHNEWLSLVDISGPFLSVKVLQTVFPQGIQRVDSGVRSDMRAAHESWADNQQGVAPEHAMHAAWIDYVLSDFLEYDDETLLKVDASAGADGENYPAAWQTTLTGRQLTLRPDFVLKDEDEEKPFMLLRVLDSRQGLEKRSTEAYSDDGDMTPATQMLELLRGTGVPLGLLTNGSSWMLVYAMQGEAASYATWNSELWFEEPVTLDAFYTLLHLRRFFAAEGESFPELMAASVSNQHDVTEKLGEQVRHAVEILVQSIAKEDANASGALLAHLDDQQIYEAALTVMMRLVFLLSAEEQGLLLLGDPVYDQNYAVSTLRGQLRDAADLVGEEVIERRTDAWARLLATFRAVYTGIWHPDLRLPAYGGSLFDPDRFPFLEGRRPDQPFDDPTLTPLQLDNRTVLHLLEALQLLELKAGGITTVRALSFRALDVEQIGHVYEGLLDHQAVRADEVVIGLTGIGGREPEIALAKLEEMEAKPSKAFNKFMKDETGRTAARIKKLRAQPIGDLRRGRMLSACGGNEALLARVLPWAGLMRDDSRKVPIVILPGEVYVTAGATRRQTGSHYTPRSLTEPIVQHTLEPLVYVGPSEGLPEADWALKSAGEILALNVCDMAMGSGAFLVQACRWLAQRLMEAWRLEPNDVNTLARDDRPFDGAYATQNLDELYALAKRLVAERCLYGVDKNPLAVEMAKLSLWLVTLSKNKPFTFVDHALRHGDSLIGIDEAAFHRWTSGMSKKPEWSLFDDENHKMIAEAKRLRKELRMMQVLDVQDAAAKAELLKRADAAMDRIRLGANLLVGLELLDWKKDYKGTKKATVQNEALLDFQAGNEFEWIAKAAVQAAQDQLAFHWRFEFPEVFEEGGFSAFVGNPPFLGSKYISSTLGAHYFGYLSAWLGLKPGKSDLCAFFFRRADEYLSSGGCVGLIATNSISEGDTQRVALKSLSIPIKRIYRASPDTSWPGVASVRITKVFWTGATVDRWKLYLNDQETPVISEYLTDLDIYEPHPLKALQHMCFQGSIPDAPGFLLTPDAAQTMLHSAHQESEVIRPFFGGTLNSDPFQEADRWCLCFKNMSEETASTFPTAFTHVVENVKELKLKKGGSSARNWWRFHRYRPALYEAIDQSRKVLVTKYTTKYLCFSMVDAQQIFTNKIAVIVNPSWYLFAALQSSLHEIWSRQFGTTLRVDLTYTPTKCFETFPIASEIECASAIGHRYHKFRQQIMQSHNKGLTATYNLFHEASEFEQDTIQLRELQVEMDNTVAAAYGWDDLALDHGFHETKQGIRFTISEAARREVLQRLLKLNHQRYAEEVAAGLHDKKKSKRKGTRRKTKPKTTPQQKTLF